MSGHDRFTDHVDAKQGTDEGGHVLGQRRLETDKRAAAGVLKTQAGGVKRLTVQGPGGLDLAHEPRLAGAAEPAPVEAVAHHRVTRLAHVHADLVGTTRLEPADHEGERLGASQHPPVGTGATTALHLARHSFAVPPMATVQGLVGPGVRQSVPMDHGQVAPVHRMIMELAPQVGMVGFRAGDHQQTRRVLIDAMDDAGPVRCAPLEIGDMVEQGVHQRAIGMTGRRMDHHANRLVHHHDRLVQMENRKGKILGLQGLGPFLSRNEDHHITHTKPLPRLARHVPVDGQPAIPESPPNLATTRTGQTTGHPSVQPLANALGTDGPFVALLHGHGG